MYLYLKSLHIIFVVTWFAGLFYIVRLFIYQIEAMDKPEPNRTILGSQLALMAKRLWLIITWPSAIITLILGTLILVTQPGWLMMPFMHIKLTFVLALYVYHFACHKIYYQLQNGVVKYTSQQLRIFNEVSTIILFAVVFLIVLKNNVDWVWGTLGLISLAVLLMIGIKFYKRSRNKHEG